MALYKLSGYSLIHKLSLLAVIVVLIYLGYAARNTNPTRLNTEINRADIVDLGKKELQTYRNEKYGISFDFPSDWDGPAVYEYENWLIAEIGNDNVYEYGTSFDDRNYTVENAYYINLKLTKRPTNISKSEYIENNASWQNIFLENVKLEDGESTSDVRTKTTKIRDVTKEDFKGAEFITSLNSTAQAEMLYMREIFLINDNYDIIVITGQPNNVTSIDKGNWQQRYADVDREYKKYFDTLYESLEISF